MTVGPLLLGVAIGCADITSIPFDFGNVPPSGLFSHAWDPAGSGTVERVTFAIRTPYRTTVSIRMVDSTGQTFQNRIYNGFDAWFPNEKAVEGPWELHYGGAKDGRFHHPLRRFELIVHGAREKDAAGSVQVRDVSFVEADPKAPKLKVAADVSGERPPKALSVELTAQGGRFPGGILAAAWTDWDGHRLAAERLACPALPSGGVWRTEIPYASLPAGKTALFCQTELQYGGRSIRREGPAWTAPVRAPLSSGPRPDLPWGTGTYLFRWGFTERGFETMERLVAAANRAGIRCLREHIYWRYVEKAGVFDFANYDRIVRICETNGMTLCMLFDAQPLSLKVTDPDFPERYGAALRQVVRHYRGRVAAWEIINEPNLPWPMASAYADNYRRVLPIATRVVHEEDPDARTVGCSASGLGLGFVRSLANEIFDDVSVHPYRRFVDEREWLDDFADLSVASRGRTVWVTEIGWDSFPGYVRANNTDPCASLHEYASLIARAYMVAAASKGVRAVFGYNFVDDGLFWSGIENHMGVLCQDQTPKPAYRALATVCRTFDSGRPELSVGEDGLTVFRMGGKCAVWVHGYEARTVSVSEGTEAKNLMGEAVVPVRSGDRHLYRADSRHPLFFDRPVEPRVEEER